MIARIAARQSMFLSAVAALALSVGSLAVAPAVQADPTVASQEQDPLTPVLQDLAEGNDPAAGPVSEVTAAGPGSVITRPSGRILVDVRMSDTDPQSLELLSATGARIRFVADDIRTVTVAIDPANLDSLAALAPLVESAQEVLQPMTNAACPTGSFVSEGLQQLRADLARNDFAVQGRDVTVGILSDAYNTKAGAQQDVENGELPGTGNPCGNTDPVGVTLEGPGDSIDEGRAMAQIVHDVAPKAKILFASAFFGEPEFAQSIRDLAAAGADIIVDDVNYFAEPMYQDGVVAKAVADVTAQGVTYFSSAANSNTIISGKNVASYEAQAFRPASCPAAVVSSYNPTPVTCHNFNPPGPSDNTYRVSFTADPNGGISLFYLLGWNEPQFGVATDLDYCVLTTAGTLVGCVKSNNLSTQDAFASVALKGSGPADLVVVRAQGAGTPRFKMISNRSRLTAVEYPDSIGGDVVGPTTFGHNASRPGVTVAAVPFNNAAVVETFSSRGPATYCWGPVVSTTPASAIPCETATVDLAATDGTQNSFFGDGSPPRFFGTSAAAPHAAAVAALLLDREQCLTPQQVIDALKTSAQPVGAAPVDAAGAGLVDAKAALTAAGVANCDTTAPVVTLTPPPANDGWYNTQSVALAAVAADRRTVKELTCTGAAVADLAGIGGTRATATATVSGEGVRDITCIGKDFEDNTGAGPGSANTATIRIDTTAPVVTCEAAVFDQGQQAVVKAAVTDAGSGPAQATVSTPVDSSAVGAFTATLEGKDVAGNSTSASCAYSVSQAMSPKVSGPSKVKAGAKKRFTASGFPASSSMRWTLLKKNKPVKKIKSTTSTSGVSKVQFRFGSKGRYVVRASVGAVKATKVVRVR